MLRVSSLLLSAVLVLSVSAVGNALTTRQCERVAQNHAADTHFFQLARSIKLCLETPLSTSLWSQIRLLKNSLPESVRNAVFLDEVCIKNKKYSEYLYSPSDEYIYKNSNPQARRVFTWVPGGVDGRWKLLPTADADTFYIVAADKDEYFTDYSVQGTSTHPGMGTHPEIATYKATPWWMHERDLLWKLTPAGDEVYIRKASVSEYVYAAEGRMNPNRRTVSLIRDTRTTLADEYLWKIVPC